MILFLKSLFSSFKSLFNWSKEKQDRPIIPRKEKHTEKIVSRKRGPGTPGYRLSQMSFRDDSRNPRYHTHLSPHKFREKFGLRTR